MNGNSRNLRYVLRSSATTVVLASEVEKVLVVFYAQKVFLCSVIVGNEEPQTPDVVDGFLQHFYLADSLAAL